MTSKADTAGNPPAVQTDISVLCDLWPDMKSLIERAIQTALRETAPAQNTYEVSIVLADDTFIRDLNKNWRGKDKPTNVLSFPQDADPGHGPVTLGDIIMAYETIAQEATAQNKTFADHALHLAIHGLLHLLGYDHENDRQAEDMEALEILILGRLGIKNPYEAGHSV
jgi:probable rRNA maturation factor